MEPHGKEKNGAETTEKAVPSVDSGDHEDFQNAEWSSRTIEWSEEFQCFTVNGMLAPIPLSAIPMETVDEEDAPQPEGPEPSVPSPGERQHGSPSTVLSTLKQEESASAHAQSGKKKRKTEGNEEFFFRIFKFPKASEQYLLETHDVKTGGIDRWHVIVHESKGRWKVGVYDLAPGDHVVVPVLQDPSPPLFHKMYELSLEERLTGWTVEKRKRGNGKEDKFYYHRARQFRSFVEVTTFILYSCKLKDLKIMSTNKSSEEVLEAGAVDAMMIISSSNKVFEITPQERNAKPDECSFSSAETADAQPNVNANSSRGIEAESKTILAYPQEEHKSGLVLKDPPHREKTEPDEIETDQFIDYISDFFLDGAPQTMTEILRETKLQ